MSDTYVEVGMNSRPGALTYRNGKRGDFESKAQIIDAF